MPVTAALTIESLYAVFQLAELSVIYEITPPTDLTNPVPPKKSCLLLNVNQSTLDKYPSKLLLDCCIVILGFAPPLENKGVVAETDDTPAAIVHDLSADKL